MKVVLVCFIRLYVANEIQQGVVKMFLCFIIGAQAVGKMTVGQELSKITGLKLFHNHTLIEPVLPLFEYFPTNLILDMRDCVFREFAQSTPEPKGMIITYVCNFDEPFEVNYIQHVVDIFQEYRNDIEFGVVELVAPLEQRLKRNVTENRLKNKASKRDIKASEGRLLKSEGMHRLVSYDNELPYDNYIKINNAELEPDIVANMIKDKFSIV